MSGWKQREGRRVHYPQRTDSEYPSARVDDSVWIGRIAHGTCDSCQPLSDVHRQINPGISSRTCANSVMDRTHGFFDRVEDLGVRLHGWSGRQFGANGDTTCFSDISSHFQALNRDLLIRRGEKPIGADQRRVIHVCRIDSYVSAREGGRSNDAERKVVEAIIHGNSGGGHW